MCSQQLTKLREEMRAVVTAPQHCLPFLQPGRLVRVLPPEHAQQAVSTAASAAAAVAAGSSSSSSSSGSGGSSEGVLGVVVNFELVGGKQEGDVAGGTASSRRGTKQYLVDVLCNCSEDSLRHQGANRRWDGCRLSAALTAPCHRLLMSPRLPSLALQLPSNCLSVALPLPSTCHSPAFPLPCTAHPPLPTISRPFPFHCPTAAC
jgi:hypothetical protein